MSNRKVSRYIKLHWKEDKKQNNILHTMKTHQKDNTLKKIKIVTFLFFIIPLKFFLNFQL